MMGEILKMHKILNNFQIIINLFNFHSIKSPNCQLHYFLCYLHINIFSERHTPTASTDDVATEYPDTTEIISIIVKKKSFSYD
jgi:hypothetical protein